MKQQTEIVIPADAVELSHIQPGERIAQLVIVPCAQPTLTEAETLPETLRGTGGFGSTGR